MDLYNFLKNEKKVILLSETGYNNIGQETMLSELSDQISLINNSIKIISNSFDPKTSCKIHPKIKFYCNFSIIFFIHALFSKYILIAGDEISTNRLDKYYNGLNYFQGKYRVIVAFISALMNKKIIFYKIGLYSLTSGYPITLLKFVFKKSQKIYVRDESSKQFIMSFCKNIDVITLKDPGYSLNFEKRKKTNKFGIALRPSHNTSSINSIKFFLKKITLNRNVVFLIFSKHPKLRQENDFNYIIELLKKENIKNQEIFYTDDPKEMKSVVSSLTFLLTQRYHGAVFADSTGVEFSVLPDVDKICLNFPDNIFDYSNFVNL